MGRRAEGNIAVLCSCKFEKMFCPLLKRMKKEEKVMYTHPILSCPIKSFAAIEIIASSTD